MVVRAYGISQYVLDHYRPFADVEGQLLYVREGLNLQIPAALSAQLGRTLITTDLPFQYPTCAWGYSPELLAVEPPAGGSGTVIGGSTTPSRTWTLTPPAGSTWSSYHWIQLTFAPGSPGAALALRDVEVSGESTEITFQSLPGGQTAYRFPIGACPQWHGYSTSSLELTSSVATTISRVELLP
jgi:hypothetical protein